MACTQSNKHKLGNTCTQADFSGKELLASLLVPSLTMCLRRFSSFAPAFQLTFCLHLAAISQLPLQDSQQPQFSSSRCKHPASKFSKRWMLFSGKHMETRTIPFMSCVVFAGLVLDAARSDRTEFCDHCRMCDIGLLVNEKLCGC